MMDEQQKDVILKVTGRPAPKHVHISVEQDPFGEGLALVKLVVDGTPYMLLGQVPNVTIAVAEPWWPKQLGVVAPEESDD